MTQIWYIHDYGKVNIFSTLKAAKDCCLATYGECEFREVAYLGNDLKDVWAYFGKGEFDRVKIVNEVVHDKGFDLA